MKAVIFDFDGVIVDSENLNCDILREEIALRGYDTTKLTNDYLIGKKTDHILTESFPQMPLELILDIAEGRRRRSIEIESIPLIPGVDTLIEYLFLERHKLGITSASRYEAIEKRLVEHDLRQYFGVITAGDDVSNSKPHPEGYLVSMQRLGVEAEDVIVVEDSPAGVISGKRAGAEVYALLTSMNNPAELPGADNYFSTHFEIMEYIKEKN